ncbi:MAG: sulfurtransferase [Rhodospirillaceae bacterium]|nr:sulfurtransferase [Rhodospirillaceae bacterium]
MSATSEFPRPEPLVSTEWLAARLDDPNLRILDCGMHLDPDPVDTYQVRSGAEDWRAGHIPGSVHADLQRDLSDTASEFRFTWPDPNHFAKAMGALGVGDGAQVVLYAPDNHNWPCRLWWMLRAHGFEAAHVLDGGLKKWKAEGRPVSTEETRYPAASFTAHPRDGMVATRQDVLAAIDDDATLILNALTPEQHAGGGAVYGRGGRISGSSNVSSRSLTDPETGAFLDPSEIRQRFEAVGALSSPKVIPYCGGGIAASTTCLLLHMLGQDAIALYDNSLSEWAKNADLPMETG